METGQLLLQIAGIAIYFIDAIIITVPGIVWFEKYHRASKLLRALEKLESGTIGKNNLEFNSLREAILDIANEQENIKNSNELILFTDVIQASGTGKGRITK